MDVELWLVPEGTLVFHQWREEVDTGRLRWGASGK
jgi:hypothetical protein